MTFDLFIGFVLSLPGLPSTAREQDAPTASLGQRPWPFVFRWCKLEATSQTVLVSGDWPTDMLCSRPLLTPSPCPMLEQMRAMYHIVSEPDKMSS